MPELGVNVDHVATIREARKIAFPDPVKAALISQAAGADSIVCHLREDRRHIQDHDLRKLKKTLKVKLNLEMAMSKEIVDIALRVRPDQVTFVPEKRRELTTEGGLDVCAKKSKVKNVIKKMERAGIGVSLFVDPNPRQIAASWKAGARLIELHTGRYADAKTRNARRKEFRALKNSARFAKKIGLKVFAGHGLNYENTKPLKSISEIEEYNIGHSIVARAVFAGLGKAVREMKRLVA